MWNQYIEAEQPPNTLEGVMLFSGQEDQPHVQGAVAVRAQDGLEELSHIEGQEGQQWGDTPRPR